MSDRTARRVAERAQDEMLIQAGKQMTAPELIKKREPLLEAEEQQQPRNSISCPHGHTKHKAIAGPFRATAKTNEDLQSTINPYFSKEFKPHHELAYRKGEVDFKNDMAAMVANSSKYSKLSSRKDRKEKDQAKSAKQQQQQKVRKGPTGEEMGAAMIGKRRSGRPVGWRKDMGLSYLDFKRMNQKGKNV